MEKKVIVITGGSSGIGLSAARFLQKQGHRVYTLSRRKRDNEPFFQMICDVREEERVRETINEIFRKEGRIDILINAAGFGISGAVEFTGKEEAKALFETDFFGLDSVCRTVIPVMRSQGRGRIINISSVAAVAGIPFQAYYSAAKAAVDSYSLALRNELRPFHIEVCSILPGDIHTGFTAVRQKSEIGDDIYQGRIKRSIEGMEKDEINGIDPDRAGAFIASIALKKKVRPQYVLGGLYKAAAFLLKILPKSFSNYLVYHLYGK